LWAALGSSGLLSAVTVAQAVLPAHPHYPVWNAIPDALAFPGSALIAWVVSQLVRRAQREYDRNWTVALRQAAVLARERERIRQASALRARLLSTVEDVVALEAVSDPVLVAQLHREVEWLRLVVDTGVGPVTALTDGGGGLLAGLRVLAAQKTADGLRVDLDLPGMEPAMPVERTAALLGAAREALTNVAKHAGVAAASLAVEVAGGQVTVRVADRGRGYDPAAVPDGSGLSGSVRGRLADVGGAATVDSAPGRGTVVTLWVPTR